MITAGRSAASSQIVGLDLLRLMAALMVTVYHLTYLEWANPHSRGAEAAALFRVYSGWTRYVDTGWVGVQIFFVISGFVIAFTANGRTAASFLRGRILRLVPGIWICATVSVFALLADGTPVMTTLKLYALSLALFPTGPWVASSYWTLPLEIVFYAMVFVVLWRRRFDQFESVVLALGTISLLAWIVTIAAKAIPGPLESAVVAITSHRLAKLLLVQHGCFFAIGAMIWIIHNWGATRSRIAIVAAFLVAGMMQIGMEAVNASAWAGLPMSPVPPIVALMGALAFVVASLRWNAAAHRMLGRGTFVVRQLGLMTFPVYLLHQPLGLSLSRLQLRAGMSPGATLLVSVSVILIVAWLVVTYLEPSFRRGLSDRLDRLEAYRIRWIIQIVSGSFS
ncbi:acyltransferase family protein [Sphingomonas sp. M6A6_1c]